ncbi:MAG: lysophospholipid acyltransferase family protein [Muribaculaceae bacterium]|nr:lysophospholipid acyltransferase family protein [Muribaculaceae bacterium]
MNICARILRLFGWTVSVTVPDYPKCIICVAPHTSNWDFVLGELAYCSVGRRAGFLMKDTWFFWPLGAIFRAIGGIAVPRKKPGKGSLTDILVEKFRKAERLVLAITPEGTRSRTSQWHTGFLHIAKQADIPIVLGAFDFPTKRIMVDRVFTPSGDIEADMRAIKDFYAPFTGKYRDKFTTE